MSELELESAGGFVLLTEQWGDELWLGIYASFDKEDAYDGKSILFDAARVRKLADWLSAWLAEKEDR